MKMPKTLNKDQIAMLDKEVKKLDKELSNKDMEKAMGMLMKKVGIKESDLDELSLSMKNITKSGISKDVGIDRDKLKMSLKDLRKKLDKDKKKNEDNKKPVHIVRSKKSTAQLHRISRNDNKLIRKEDRDSKPISTSKKSGNFLSTKDGAGMTKKGVAAFRRKNPGSKLQTAVTGKVKPGSKAAARRKSFCARSRGWTGERGKAARRRWKC